MGLTNLEIVRERREHRERVIGEAREWASSLKIRATVILAGSYARGDFNLWSDVDVILVSDFKGNPLERLKTVSSPPGYEVIPLTPRELALQLEKGNPLIVEAVCRGIVLRDDYQILDEKRLKKRLCK